MGLRATTNPLMGDMRSMGMLSLDTDGVTPLMPDGTPLAPAGAIQNATPTTGQTVTTPNDKKTGLLYLTPAGTLAALTVTLPSNANSQLGQMRRITSTQIITALTIGQAGGGATILGAPSGLTAGQTINLIKVAANTWACEQ